MFRSIVALLLLSTATLGCGAESLFSQGGFRPTPPPEAQLTGVVSDLTLAAGPASHSVSGPIAVYAYGPDGSSLGFTRAAPGERFTLKLGAAQDFSNVRVVAHVGSIVVKGFAANVPRQKAPVDVGTLDEVTTAATLVLEQRASDEGGLAGMSGMEAIDLFNQASAGDGAAAEVNTFAALVRDLMDRGNAAAQDGATLSFGDTDPTLDQAYLDENAIDDHTVDEYTMALAAAAAALQIDLTCDPSLIRVMFTVDTSGDARDGNGARQLIRQPPKEGKIFLGITVDDTSPVSDPGGLLKTKIVPNDPDTEMFDDGTNGDEVAGDGIFTRVLTLPRGMRVIYKYMNGSVGDGFTRTEEWPGNARLLVVEDVLTRHADGRPDCLVIRRDAFGDEATNKNHVNLSRQLSASGGNLSYDADLGGDMLPPAKMLSDGSQGLIAGGLAILDLRQKPGLTPLGVAEARENGVCSACPAPLTVAGNDSTPPTVLSANFISTSEVRVTFSEPLDFASAGKTASYLIVDDAQRVLAVLGVAASQDKVTLSVGPPDLARRYTLHLKGGATGLTDASKAKNPIADGTSVVIGPDVTPPQPLSVRATNKRELTPDAPLDDPTTGDVVVVTFNEELDQSSAEDATHYQVLNALGVPFPVHAAFLRGREVFLVTDTQEKRRRYQVIASGVRDLSGNPMDKGMPMPFDGFALYRAVFGAVPGFAWASASGLNGSTDPSGMMVPGLRGIPNGEKLYLTGTMMSVARDLSGTDISLGGRTDLTGVAEFEMTASSDPTDVVMSAAGESQPVYRLTVLVPPGVYAWKVAHGVEGEWRMPPTTLEKVTKALATTNDATGIIIDPRDGIATNGADYSKAKLSVDATEPESAKILFKRENPDELCDVNSERPAPGQDSPDTVSCPVIMVSTWRDLPDFYASGQLLDYDDGVRTLPTIRPLEPDTAPPELYDVRACDASTLLLTFSEKLDVSMTPNQPGGPLFSIVDQNSMPLAIDSAQTGMPRPHQVTLTTDAMPDNAAYTLSYGGLTDAVGNVLMETRTATFVAPPASLPCPQVDDGLPPQLISAVPESPTSVRVRFSKHIAAASADASHFSIVARDGSSPPSVQDATLAGGGTDVVLTTAPQTVEGQYTLVAKQIADTVDPPQILDQGTQDFVGFGDRNPPSIAFADAISPTQVVVVFSKPMDPGSAADPTSYAIAGLTVMAAEFSGSNAIKMAAFDPANAPVVEDTVLLTTTTQAGGMAYSLTASAAKDLSGNPVGDAATSFSGAAAARTVDVVFAYTVSNTTTVAGQIPPRALDPARLDAEREGVFMRGTTFSADGTMQGSPTDPVNVAMGGFPAEGQPLDGAEPQLKDDGMAPDVLAGDRIYTIKIAGVPLGTAIEWKAFASYTVAWKTAHPMDSGAAFADATPGPSAYGDGQEYPGNENGVRILGDKNGDGVVVINVLFGDETSYKKFTDKPAFRWITDDVTWVR